MEEHTGSIIVVVFCVILSGYFSATETAFTSFNRIRLKNSATDGDEGAKKVLNLAGKYDKLLSTVLIGNNVVNIMMTAVGTSMFISLYGSTYGPTIATAVMTIVVLIFGEISPKNLAKENPEAFAKFSAPYIGFLMVVLTPINYIFSLWKMLLIKVFRTKGRTGITEDELLIIVEEAETVGSINNEHSELIQNAIEFNELEAWDVMTPRVDIMAVEVSTPKKDIAEKFIETGFSRLPVYDDDMDNIVGVLNQKDFHNYIYHTECKILEYVKPVIYVVGSIKIAVLLKKLKQKKTHLAIIVDEYGGTDGIVTMEDIIEELVGEIYDEHDEVESEEIVKLQDGSYRVQCSTNFDKMLDYFDVYEDVNVTTVNGWVVLQLDKIPAQGDSFVYDMAEKEFHVKVTKSDERKAIEINLKVIEKEKSEK